MESKLKDLYIGNVDFAERFYPRAPLFAGATKRKLEGMEEQLNALLDDQGKGIFEEYCAAQREREDLVRYDTFTQTQAETLSTRGVLLPP